jgi:transcriptional regulator with XRE-family HTH domain
VEGKQKFKSLNEAVSEYVAALPEREWTKEDGQRLRRFRESKELSQRLISAKGVSYPYISRIEAGSRRPSAMALVKLALILDVQFDYLALGQGEPLPLTDSQRHDFYVVLGANEEKAAELDRLHQEVAAAFERLAEARWLLGQTP